MRGCAISGDDERSVALWGGDRMVGGRARSENVGQKRDNKLNSGSDVYFLADPDADIGNIVHERAINTSLRGLNSSCYYHQRFYLGATKTAPRTA